jgi:hypothetical protein
VVQADLILGLLKALLHHPAGPGYPDQAEQGSFGRAEARVEGQLTVAAAAAYQQPPLAAGSRQRGQLDACPVIQPPSLGAMTGAAGHPLLGGHASGQLDSGGRLLGGRSQRLGALDGQHIGHAAAF